MQRLLHKSLEALQDIFGHSIVSSSAFASRWRFEALALKSLWGRRSVLEIPVQGLGACQHNGDAQNASNRSPHQLSASHGTRADFTFCSAIRGEGDLVLVSSRLVSASSLINRSVPLTGRSNLLSREHEQGPNFTTQSEAIGNICLIAFTSFEGAEDHSDLPYKLGSEREEVSLGVLILFIIELGIANEQSNGYSCH